MIAVPGLFVTRSRKEQGSSARQHRQRIAVFAHAVDIFRVRQFQGFAVSVRIRDAQLRRCVGEGIDLAVPDTLPIRIRNTDGIQVRRLAVALSIRKLGNVHLRGSIRLRFRCLLRVRGAASCAAGGQGKQEYQEESEYCLFHRIHLCIVFDNI